MTIIINAYYTVKIESYIQMQHKSNHWSEKISVQILSESQLYRS